MAKTPEAPGLEPTKPARAPHEAIYDPKCQICVSPERIEIEADYQNSKGSVSKLSEKYDVAATELDRHINALDLDVVRLDRTDKLAAMLMEKGIERVEEGREAVTVDHLVKMMEHKDKKEGRIVQRVQVTKPSVIVFRNIPSPLALEPADDTALGPDEIPLIAAKVSSPDE